VRNPLLDSDPTGTSGPVPDDDPTAHQPGAGARLLRDSAEVVVLMAIAWGLAQLIKMFVAEGYMTPTGSMLPTVLPRQDFLMASKITLRFRGPQVGEIVVADDPEGVLPAIMKRVIAVGGQTVDIRDGKVHIDGQALDEPYVRGQATLPGTVQLPVKIPQGYVWLMGDNRGNSKDSRWIGPRPVSSIRAIAFFRYWPVSRIGVP
jgi:signal peptidase I